MVDFIALKMSFSHFIPWGCFRDQSPQWVPGVLHVIDLGFPSPLLSSLIPPPSLFGAINSFLVFCRTSLFPSTPAHTQPLGLWARLNLASVSQLLSTNTYEGASCKQRQSPPVEEFWRQCQLQNIDFFYLITERGWRYFIARTQVLEETIVMWCHVVPAVNCKSGWLLTASAACQPRMGQASMHQTGTSLEVAVLLQSRRLQV